jgi:hypothetical protein
MNCKQSWRYLCRNWGFYSGSSIWTNVSEECITCIFTLELYLATCYHIGFLLSTLTVHDNISWKIGDFLLKLNNLFPCMVLFCILNAENSADAKGYGNSVFFFSLRAVTLLQEAVNNLKFIFFCLQGECLDYKTWWDNCNKEREVKEISWALEENLEHGGWCKWTKTYKAYNNILKENFVKFLPIKYYCGAFNVFCQCNCSEATISRCFCTTSVPFFAQLWWDNCQLWME